jgi:cardiolipin synthase (CMP-forming)
MKKSFVWYVPNGLTILRMIMVPFFAFLMLKDRIDLAVWVFLAAAATDMLDGFIARKYQVITFFGKIMDPLADKLMQLTALFMLARVNYVMAIIPWLVLVKEMFLFISGMFLIRKKVDMSAKWFGKITTVLFVFAITLTFFGIPKLVTDILLWLSLGMAVFAACMYTLHYVTNKNKQVGFTTKEDHG